jgi:hypothetical protein
MKKLYLVGLAAVFVAFATLGFQCQKVTDPASDGSTDYGNSEYAPPFDPSDCKNPESCRSACNDYYAKILKAENQRHIQVMKKLRGNSKAVKKLRLEEIKRHVDAVRDILRACRQCIRSCHDQGGLHGGF